MGNQTSPENNITDFCGKHNRHGIHRAHQIQVNYISSDTITHASLVFRYFKSLWIPMISTARQLLTTSQIMNWRSIEVYGTVMWPLIKI